MKFAHVADNTKIADGFTAARFKGIEKVTMPDGKQLYKFQFKLCVFRDGSMQDIEFNTGIIASSKETPEALSESLVKQLCEAIGIAYSPDVDIPMVNDSNFPDVFKKPVKIYMKTVVRPGKSDVVNMGWHETKAIWPLTSLATPTAKDYGI